MALIDCEEMEEAKHGFYSKSHVGQLLGYGRSHSWPLYAPTGEVGDPQQRLPTIVFQKV